MLVDTSDAWRCLFEGHSNVSGRLTTLNVSGRHTTLNVWGRQTTLNVSGQEDARSCPQTRIASLLTLCPGALFAAFSHFEHLADVIIFNVNENQYGDCIQNSGGWVMVGRRGREAKVENSIN